MLHPIFVSIKMDITSDSSTGVEGVGQRLAVAIEWITITVVASAELIKNFINFVKQSNCGYYS